jgi:hypothetical protein
VVDAARGDKEQRTDATQQAAEQVIQEWAAMVASLHEATACDQADERAAYQATANLLSGHGGLPYAPPALRKLIADTIEIGYLSALRDIHDGRIEP